MGLAKTRKQLIANVVKICCEKTDRYSLKESKPVTLTDSPGLD